MSYQDKEPEHLIKSCENVSGNYEQVHPVTDMKTRADMQSILDALQCEDYDFARAICPSDKKLIGYEIIESPRDITQYGSYAADFWTTRVPAGIYPVFAREYTYNEAKELYTNQIKDFNGLFAWKEGLIVSSNFEKDIGKTNVVLETPYAHSIAHIVLENPARDIHLLPPFCAQKVYFTYDNEIHHTYQIIDSSLPEYLETNPIKLENKPSFDTLLKNAKRQPPPPALPNKKEKIK